MLIHISKSIRFHYPFNLILTLSEALSFKGVMTRSMVDALSELFGADKGEKLHSETLFLYFCWTFTLYRLV